MINKIKFKKSALTRVFVAILMLGVGILWAGLSNISSAYADDAGGNSIFITPMTQKIVLVPGETYNGSLTISNNASSTNDLKYKAEIGSYNRRQDGDSKDDYGVTDVTEVTNYNVMMKWITLEKDSGEVAPNESDVLNFTIEVPKSAPAGAQYASILVYKDTDEDSSSSDGANISTKFQMASAIIANVAGETIEKGSITENNMPSVLTNSKLEATSMVRNEGNIYTDATYTLQVWPMTSDEEICTNEESVETSMILPSTERYHTQTCNLPAFGIFRAKQVVTIFGEESVLEKTIIVCPVWLMIVILVIIIVIVAGVIIIIRKHTKKSE